MLAKELSSRFDGNVLIMSNIIGVITWAGCKAVAEVTGEFMIFEIDRADGVNAGDLEHSSNATWPRDLVSSSGPLPLGFRGHLTAFWKLLVTHALLLGLKVILSVKVLFDEAVAWLLVKI